MSPLDTPLALTIFPDHFGKTKRTYEMSLREFGLLFQRTHRTEKAKLPVVKLQTFGKKRTAEGCLRNNDNVKSFTGIEIDYDADGQFAGENTISLHEAAEIFERANVAALIYPTWSYHDGKPSWRALCPCSEALAPQRREKYVARVNGLFAGCLDQHASFTLSQAMYFGRHGDARGFILSPTPQFADGRFIDECDDLDAGALAKQVKPHDTSGERAPDESRNGRHFREAMKSARNGLSYDKHLDCLDSDLFDYTQEARGSAPYSGPAPEGRKTKGEKDWKDAVAKVEKESASIADKFTDYSDDDGDSNSSDESDFLTAEQMAALERPFDFLEGLLFEQQLSMVYGAPKAGKSFLIMDMACAVGMGRTWAGRQCDPRNVLVIPLEGRGTIIDRVRAWEMENDAKCPLIFRPKPLDLINGAKDVKAIIRYVKNHHVGLVIIDTLSRAIPGAEENSATDMSKAVRVADMICRAGAHTMLVHHAGKAGTMRGSNALIGAPDLVIKLTRNGEQRLAIIEENRHGKDGEVLRFTLEPRRTDIIDARNKAVHSAVVKLEGEWFEDLSEREPKPKVTEREQAALDIMRPLISKLGYIYRDEARLLLRRKGWGPSGAEAWKKAFARVLEALEQKNALVVDSNDALSLQ